MLTNLINKIENFIKKKGLIADGATLIIGLSGGPDSVFLLHFLAQLKDKKNLNLIVAHLDHEWRQSSKDDAQFCKELAASYNLEFICKIIKDLNLNIKFNGSKEELGRKARRTFFESLAQQYNASGIVLAHHADDQMETFFIRMVRGASLSGLAGMKAKDGLYIRPLLEIKKEQILAYLKEHNLAYVIDESNNSDEFLRNRLRNMLIHNMINIDNRFENNFVKAHKNIQDTEEFLQITAKNSLQTLLANDNSLNFKKLTSHHIILQKYIIIEWLCNNKIKFNPSSGLLNEILRFLENKSSQHNFYNKWSLIKKDSSLIIKNHE